MSNLYAMRRANGDWFAFEVRGRLRVPLFHSREDALISRLRNFGMLVFRPVGLDPHLLQSMVPRSDVNEVDFCMIDNPRASLTRGKLVDPAQLGLQVPNSDRYKTVPNIKAPIAAAASLVSPK
jgi:hypothetical protein